MRAATKKQSAGTSTATTGVTGATASEDAGDFPGAPAVNAYIATLSGARQLSPNTVRNYTSALRDFCLWAKTESGFAGDFATISRRLARDFIIEKQRTHERTTVHLHLAALRGLYRHLLRTGSVECSPFTGLHSPKLPKRLPRFLTETQMAELLGAPAKLHAAGRLDAWTRVRDTAILECLYGAGLRVSELCGLDYERVDFSTGLLRVLGKGRKERLVPVGEKAIAALQKLRLYGTGGGVKDTAAGRPSRTTGGAVFTADATRRHRLYPRAVQLLLKRHLAAAGLPSDLTPHKLRHTCATHLLDHDADLRMIQEQLGHASLSTTQIYTHVSLARLKAAHSKAHPRA